MGQSKNIKKRLEGHKSSLKCNKNVNKKMQEDYNIDSSAFSFEIVEFCTLKELNEKEKYWIEKMNAIEHGYNSAPGGRGVTFKESENSKLRKEVLQLKKDYIEKYRCPISLCRTKEIYCITTKEIFESAKQASEKYPSSDESSILKCCKHIDRKGTHSSGKINGQKLFWCYAGNKKFFEDKTIDEINKYFEGLNTAYRGRKIICLNTGEIYNSLKEASLQIGLSCQSIEDNLKGRTKVSKGNLVFLYVENLY